MENLIKLHKSQLGSDRMSCRSPIANQARLALHTAAYLSMLKLRHAISKQRELAKAEFDTLRLRLIKIAACVIGTASRVRLAFAARCPEVDLFKSLPAALASQGPCPAGREALRPPSPIHRRHNNRVRPAANAFDELAANGQAGGLDRLEWLALLLDREVFLRQEATGSRGTTIWFSWGRPASEKAGWSLRWVTRPAGITNRVSINARPDCSRTLRCDAATVAIPVS